MFKRASRVLGVLVVAAMVNCSGPYTPASTPTTNTTILRIYSTTAVTPLLHDITAAYTLETQGVIFESQQGNHVAMIEQLQSGKTPYIITNYLKDDSSLWAAPIAQDAIAIITHPSNPIGSIDRETLRQIYQGIIHNWADIGGADQPIVVFSRETGSGTRLVFERLVMGTRQTTPSARIAPTSSAMLLSIMEETGSIGYISMGYLPDERVKIIAVDDVLPTTEAVGENIYPLRTPVYITGYEEAEGAYRAFIGWIQSLSGQAIVSRRYAPLFTTP